MRELMHNPQMLAQLGLAAVVVAWLVVLTVRQSRLRQRYAQMMSGEETGATFEQMMLDHIKATDALAVDNRAIHDSLHEIADLLSRAVTRVAVVRFSAFENVGGDLSYAVAMLDAHNNGVVFSSLFAREDSRSYAKPIVAGKSTYPLTNEETQALKQAMAK